MGKVIYMIGCEPKNNESSKSISEKKKEFLERARNNMLLNNSGMLQEVELEILSAESDKKAEQALNLGLSKAHAQFGRNGMY